MKRIWICLLLALVLLITQGCSGDQSWTDRDLTKATAVMVVSYGTSGKSYEKMFYTTSDEKLVHNISNTFSKLVTERVRTAETLEIAYCVYFKDDAGNEIEHIYLYSDNCTVQSRTGKMYRITDEMDLNRHLREEIVPKMNFMYLVLPDED